jgi:hypothetical protein
MINNVKAGLAPRHTPGASVDRIANGWRLEIPASSANHEYCLAQVDDYLPLTRGRFLHSPPWTLSLNARVSHPSFPGTWGFGLWNDPFGLSLGFGGKAGRFPTLPNAAWFIYASSPNWLSVHDSIPAHDFIAAVIKSPSFPSILLAPVTLALPLTIIRPFSRLLRRLAARVIRQDATLVPTGVTDWHKYSFKWLREKCEYFIDEVPILQTRFSPPPPLGLVIWIDNQYAAWDPQGQLAYGTLEHPAAWLEISEMKMV